MSAETKMRRVFVGVKVTPETSAELMALQEQVKHLPVYLVPPEEMHITLVPPFDVESPESVASAISTVLREKAPNAFSTTLQSLTINKHKNTARQIWVQAGYPNELSTLRSILFQSIKQQEDRPFTPHITLARIPRKEQDRIVLPDLKMDIDIHMDVREIALYESLAPRAHGYTILHTWELENV